MDRKSLPLVLVLSLIIITSSPINAQEQPLYFGDGTITLEKLLELRPIGDYLQPDGPAVKPVDGLLVSWKDRELGNTVTVDFYDTGHAPPIWTNSHPDSRFYLVRIFFLPR